MCAATHSDDSFDAQRIRNLHLPRRPALVSRAYLRYILTSKVVPSAANDLAVPHRNHREEAVLLPLDFFSQHVSWWTIEHVKTLFEVAAYVAALIFFVYKAGTGYMITEMALTISCKRARCSRSDDHLAVVATLKKGKKGTLRLHDAQARIISLGAPPHTQIEDLISVERLTFRKDSTKWPWKTRRKIAWTTSRKKPFLNLAPGDQAQFACTCVVPATAPASVEVVVLAWRWFSLKRSQWRSSAISLPLPPPHP